LACGSGVATLRLYHSTFSDHTATFATPLTVLPPAATPSFTLERMEGPTMVSSTPYSITVELEAPHRNFEATHTGNYNSIGGYKLLMVADADVADDEEPIHVATLRPSDDFTFRSPCAASHPRTRQYTVTGLEPGAGYAFAAIALCCDPQGGDSEVSAFTPMQTLPPVVPESPENLTATPQSWSEVALTWDEPADHTFAISEYIILGGEVSAASSSSSRTADEAGLTILGRTSLLEHTVQTLEADTLYRFAVVAINAAGGSMPAEGAATTLAALATYKPAPPVLDEVSYVG